MAKDKFKTSILILILGGFIVKILGFVVKILYTRIIGMEGVSLYTIVMPTYSLFITLASFALPISISKLISEKKHSSKKIIFSTALLMMVFNVILMLIVIFLAPFISHVLLKNNEAYYLLIAMAFTLPFISATSILKGYFLGKLKVYPNTISNIFEQIVRILFLLYFLPNICKTSILLAVISLILLNILSEITSMIVFMFFLPKGKVIKKEDMVVDKQIIKDVLGTSVFSVSSRFIGNIGFFLEPIILTNCLLLAGYNSDFILREYAAYNAYALGLLTMPSFFVGAICQILIPEMSKYQALNNDEMKRRRFWQAIVYSFLIGLFFSIFILIFRNALLNMLYKTTLGSNYVLFLSPFFVLFYVEAPLISTLQALGHARVSMKITLYGEVLKLLLLCGLSFLKIGLFSLVIAEIVNIFFVVCADYLAVKKNL